MAAAMAERGVSTPFPIQAATLPDALAGLDLCGRAPTGSGKTIAFGIPLVLGVGRAHPKRPKGLVLVPTRELASQVAHELQLLAKPKGPWVEAFYGGVGFDRQISALKRGVDVVVACPGRLADLINRKHLTLRDVSYVVIDEADRMADMGFLPEVKRLLDQCSGPHQTLLFSATLDGDVDVLIRNYQNDPVRHEFGGHDDDHANSSKADHFFWAVERNERLHLTASIIKGSGPTVVFCRTKRGADRVSDQLGRQGVKSAAIHGDRSQNARERALRQFHKGDVEALVATDVAARGIHVDGVTCVVHYDPPEDPKDYVHRSGRTARAGAAGVVVSLVSADLRKDVAKLQRTLGYEPELTAPDATLLTTILPLDASPLEATTTDQASRDTKARVNAEVEALEGRALDQRAPRQPKARAERSHSAASGRPPLAEGQRRPSGASRRKAKKENGFGPASGASRDNRPHSGSDRDTNHTPYRTSDHRSDSQETHRRVDTAPTGRPSNGRKPARPVTAGPGNAATGRPGNKAARAARAAANGVPARPSTPRASARPSSRPSSTRSTATTPAPRTRKDQAR